MKLISKKLIEVTETPVCDISVPIFENFALSMNLVVHNSKDISDGLAGVLAGALSRREMWGLYGIAPMEIPDVARSVVKDSKDTEKLQK